MEIPAQVEQAIGEAVARRLEAELGERGLLLTADRLAAAAVEAAQRGAGLRAGVMHQCYPSIRHAGQALEFESEHTAARLDAALAFGAAAAGVLVPAGHDLGDSELLCAMFNLGIGLVDGVCDGDARIGGALLELVEGQDLGEAAEEPRRRGWLRATLPPALAEDPTVAFTVDIIETFFETLHAVYPGDARLPLRRRVGAQLGAALEAERRSVVRPAGEAAHEQLIEWSRLTSVLPFQIIETLARGEHAPADLSAGMQLGEASAGMQLGEALWRIDDLVDLCQDARSGSLNGVLLAAATGPDGERMPAPAEIARSAAEAAELLRAGLRLARGGDASGDHPRTAPFLFFIQRYAGIAPHRAS